MLFWEEKLSAMSLVPATLLGEEKPSAEGLVNSISPAQGCPCNHTC